MHYRLDSFYDCDCRDRTGRAGLFASDDLQAIDQTHRALWQCECAGQSRVLVLCRPSTAGWFEIARAGTRRYAGHV